MHQEGMWRGRPASVWMLALLDVVGGLLCTYGAIAPPTPRSPAGINAVGAVVAFTLAALLWHRGRDRTPWVLVHLNLGVHLVATTVIVANAATGEGALSAAASFVLVAMYLGIVLPRPVARGYVVAAIGGLAAALLASATLTFSLAVWLPPALSIIAATEVLAMLTRGLRDASRTDHLTGLYNRYGFHAVVARELAVTARSGAPLVLVVVDLDGFKQVNDRHGHAAGDHLLTGLAAEWQTALRPRDRVCRTGGDEFTFVLPDTDEQEAVRTMQRLQDSSDHAWSFGVARHLPGESLEACLARADRALYAAKHRSRGRDGRSGTSLTATA